MRCLARRRFLWLLLPGPPLGTPHRRLSAARRAPKFVSLPDTLWLLLPPSPVALLCSGCSSRAWRFRRTSPLLERAGVNLPRGPSVLGLLPGAQARRLDCSCFYRRLWVVSNSGTACLRGCAFVFSFAGLLQGARTCVCVCLHLHASSQILEHVCFFPPLFLSFFFIFNAARAYRRALAVS